MRLLIDNSLSPKLADMLAGAGFAAIHIRTLMSPDSPDSAIFELAAREGWVIIAHDTDFGALLARRRASKPSVILIRQRAKSKLAVLNALVAVIAQADAELAAGALVVVEDDRIRVRVLPICP